MEVITKFSDFTRKPWFRILTAGIGLSFGLVSSFCTLRVKKGQRVVLYNRIHGPLNIVLSEGFHYYNPLVNAAYFFKVEKQVKVIHVDNVGTSDSNMFNVLLQIEYKPDLAKLPQLMEQSGTNYAEKTLPPIAIYVVKRTIADVKKSEIESDSHEVTLKVNDALRLKLAEASIQLESASLRFLSILEDRHEMVEEFVDKHDSLS